MEKRKPVDVYSMPDPSDDFPEEESLESTIGPQPSISRKKYQSAQEALDRYARLLRIVGEEHTVRPRRKIFRGFLEGVEGSDTARYIDEAMTAYPGRVFIHTRGVRNEQSIPDDEALNTSRDIGAYHIAVGLDMFKRAIIVNSTNRRMINRIQKEIFQELMGDWDAPVDILYRLVEETYKGIKAKGTDKPLIMWAATHRPQEKLSETE